MTDKRPTPDDRELDQYLQGDSKLSRRYREASGETAPPELDDAILAQARSELRRRPHGINRWLAPTALAASVMLGINLAWNVYQAQPLPGEKAQFEDAAPVAEELQAIAPAAPPPALESASEPKLSQAAPQFVPDAPAASDLAGAGAAKRAETRVAEAEVQSQRQAEEDAQRKAEARREQAFAAEQERTMQKQAAAPLRRDALAGAATESAAPTAAAAPAAAPQPWTEAEKIERLITFVAGLHDVDFIRNGKEHSPEDAAKHMRMKLEKAGHRVKTADDFIRLCASHSYITKEAYLIRFPDGRTRTAEDVLREQLATMP
jgi:hypothetical protein